MNKQKSTIYNIIGRALKESRRRNMANLYGLELKGRKQDVVCPKEQESFGFRENQNRALE